MSQLARDKFQVGDRIKMTQPAIDQGLHGYKADRRTGAVKGFPFSATVGDPEKLVFVLRDGESSRKCYHMDFWEVDYERMKQA